MSKPHNILIVGGGVAGLASALALKKAGIDSVVLEARSPDETTSGVFLTLGSNGLDALRTLDADARVREAGFPTPTITLRSGTGRRLGETPISGTAPDAIPSVTIKRSDLYAALRDEVTERGLGIEYGRKLVDVRRAGEGVRAVFADGSEVEGDAIIGADGVHSTVRRLIDSGAPAPVYAGLLNTGGYVRNVPVDVPPGTYEMIFGKRAFFGYVLSPAGEVWWFANLPRADEPTRGELAGTGGAALRKQLLDLFAGDAGPAVRIVASTPEITDLLPVHTIPHLPRWHDDRLVVIGDAAHAPSPSSGQGASLAIEDAVVLARCLRDGRDVRSAFARFEAERRPRVEAIIKWAARINNSKVAGPLGRVVRDAVLPIVLKLTARSGMIGEMYDYHVDWGGPAAASARSEVASTRAA